MSSDVGSVRATAPTQALASKDCSEHRKWMLSRASYWLGDTEHAEDAVQEAFRKALGSDFRGESGVKTWLYRILLNVCLDIRESANARHARNGVDLDAKLENTLRSPKPSAYDCAYGGEIMRRITWSLRMLEEKERQAWEARFLGQLSYMEVASLLDVSERTAKNLVWRTNQKMKFYLRKFSLTGVPGK